MNRRTINLLLLAATALSVYLALDNRRLSGRLSRVEELLRRAQSAARASASEPEQDPLHRVPQRATQGASPRIPLKPQPVLESQPGPSSPNQEQTASEQPQPGEPEVRAMTSKSETVVEPAPPVTVPALVPELDWVRYFAQSGSRCQVQVRWGASSIVLASEVVAGQIAIAPGLDFDHREAMAEFPTNLPCAATMVLPARSLLGTRSAVTGQRALLAGAVEISRFPNLRYELRQLYFEDKQTNTTESLWFRSVGDLTVHGATKSVEAPLLVTPKADGELIVLGQAQVKMTDFGIKLPVSEWGVRAEDELRVDLSWKLKRVSAVNDK